MAVHTAWFMRHGLHAFHAALDEEVKTHRVFAEVTTTRGLDSWPVKISVIATTMCHYQGYQGEGKGRGVGRVGVFGTKQDPRCGLIAIAFFLIGVRETS